VRFCIWSWVIGLLGVFLPYVALAQNPDTPQPEAVALQANVLDAQRLILGAFLSAPPPVAESFEGVAARYELGEARLTIFVVSPDEGRTEEIAPEAAILPMRAIFLEIVGRIPLPAHVTLERDADAVIFTEPIQSLGVALGSSTSNTAGCFEGTVGVAVYDKDDRSIQGYVTCNHVAAGEPPLLCPNGEGAKQVVPATAMMNCHGSHVVGRVLRRHPINPIPSIDNEVDAAFVQTNHHVDPEGCRHLIRPNGSAYRLGETPLNPVRKCGARTHYTENGEVKWSDALIRIPFMPCGMTATFIHQIVVKGSQFARAGDSGAWVFDSTGKAVGMIFAGDEEMYTFVNPASEVLRLLRLELSP
jgi:hypothetical protein